MTSDELWELVGRVERERLDFKRGFREECLGDDEPIATFEVGDITRRERIPEYPEPALREALLDGPLVDDLDEFPTSARKR